MSRLPSLTPRQLVAALKKAGFREHHQRGSHLYLWEPEHTVMVTVPMHARDLPRGTLKAILRQSGLTDEELRALL